MEKEIKLVVAAIALCCTQAMAQTDTSSQRIKSNKNYPHSGTMRDSSERRTTNPSYNQPDSMHNSRSMHNSDGRSTMDSTRRMNPSMKKDTIY
jgi:hypothetical protein